MIQDLPAESVGDIEYKTYLQRALGMSDTRLTSRERWGCLIQDLPAESVGDV